MCKVGVIKSNYIESPGRYSIKYVTRVVLLKEPVVTEVQSRFGIETAAIKLAFRDAYNGITFMNMFHRAKRRCLKWSRAQKVFVQCDIRNINSASAYEGVTFLPIPVAVRSKL